MSDHANLSLHAVRSNSVAGEAAIRNQQMRQSIVTKVGRLLLAAQFAGVALIYAKSAAVGALSPELHEYHTRLMGVTCDSPLRNL